VLRYDPVYPWYSNAVTVTHSDKLQKYEKAQNYASLKNKNVKKIIFTTETNCKSTAFLKQKEITAVHVDFEEAIKL